MGTTVERYDRLTIAKRALQERLHIEGTSNATLMVKVNRALNARLIRLADDGPTGVFQQRFQATFEPDYTTGTVAVNATDAHVFETATGTWDVTGRWDARYIEIKTSAGVYHRRRIQEVWTSGGTYYVSVLKPWPNNADTGMTYRVYEPGILLDPSITHISALMPWEEGTRYPDIPFLGSGFVEAAGWFDHQGRDAGSIPSVAYQGERWKLPDPLLAPTVALDGQTVWAGPEPAGAFTFLYTRIWGYEEEEELTSPFTAKTPRLESGPSAESGEAVPIYSTSSVVITVPEIDWMRGFNITGTTRKTRGGVGTRIYVARRTSVGGSHATIETPEVYHHLVDIAGDATTYTWNGSISPNYHIRHRTSHGRLLLRLDPRPNSRLEFRYRAKVRPAPLLHDNDSVELPPEVCDVLVDGLAADLAKFLGTTEQVVLFENDYRTGIERLVGNHDQPMRPVKRRRRQARGLRGGKLQERIPAKFTGT